MEAGRELDALVAEKVMGLAFVRKTVGDGPWAEEILMLTDAGCTCGTCQKTGNTEMIHGPLMHGMAYPQVPEYSTQIWAAWEVVEKLAKDRWHVMVRYDQGRGYSGLWWTCAAHLDNSIEGFRRDAETAPLVICLAALAAMSPGG